MATLPQLLEEDIRDIQATLEEFRARTEAALVLMTAEGGFLITHCGREDLTDITSLGSVAGNTFEANKAIASMLGEATFNSIYQQGENLSLLLVNIDGFNLLIVVFPASVAVGLVKYYAQSASTALATVLVRARERTPGQGLDLVLMNPSDSEAIFKKQGG